MKVDRTRPRKYSDRYERIWAAIRKIPRGRVATYGQIARVAGMEGQPRLVGYALHALPEGFRVPWHRVINSKGSISLIGPSGRRQRRLLEDEKVIFSPAGKVNLRLYQWKEKS